MASTVGLILTNDWELFGEGSGDFHLIQEKRLADLLGTAERFGARLSVFAEVGQQFAHLRSESLPHRHIASAWEASLRKAVARGHDVQLHYHPTWNEARHVDGTWHLDLDHWTAASLGEGVLVDRLREGREYLDSVLKRESSDYACVAFRAGAFALQPLDLTLPAIAKAGLLCDSSIVPGYWDFLHFDYRGYGSSPGPRTIQGGGVSLFELPVHTESVWDLPALRRIFPAHVSLRLSFGIDRDPVYESWAKLRDQTLREVCTILDPLESQRRRARSSITRWPGYVVRRSAHVLDYDFMQPDLFTKLVRRALTRAEADGLGGELPLVALGHANNAHSTENLARTLQALKAEFGAQLVFRTLREVVSERVVSVSSAAGTARTVAAPTAASAGSRSRK